MDKVPCQIAKRNRLKHTPFWQGTCEKDASVGISEKYLLRLYEWIYVLPQE